jgi:hypothetical protein
MEEYKNRKNITEGEKVGEGKEDYNNKRTPMN